MPALLKGLRRFAAAAAWIAALAGCAADEGADPIEASAFCGAYVEAVCGGLDSCCPGSFNRSECERAQLESCEQNILTLDDRGIAPTGPNAPARIVFDFDEEGAGEALARIRGQLASCNVDALDISMFEATHYLGEPGSECLRNEDCVEGTRCEHPELAVFGTCVIAPLPGELCDDVCAYRQDQCVVDPLDGRNLPVCVSPRGEGQSCDIVGCETGLVCGTSRESFEQICKRGAQLGESCTSDTECASELCDGGRCASAAVQFLCSEFGSFGF